MAELIPQFQDLTEVRSIGYEKDREIDSIQTEFSFIVAAPGQCIKYHVARDFQHISSMNNWWPSHSGQNRELKFLWKRNKNGNNLEREPERVHWDFCDTRYKQLSAQLAAGGCGFKLAVPPISFKEHYRYFTLMRMPVVVSPFRQKFLEKLNYHLIDTGKLASYWINGWKPEVYSHAMEYKFFGITNDIWAARGSEWLSYNTKQHL